MRTYLVIVFPEKVSEVGVLGIGTLLEPSSCANQIGDAHLSGERIAARPCHFSLDVDRGGVTGRRVAVDEHAIARSQDDVVGRIALQRAFEFHVQDFQGAVGHVTEYLSVGG